jgi:hypothetical protein
MTIIFRFASTSPNGLFAFAGDPSGDRLPKKHGPWRPDGSIQAYQSPPFNLDRAAIEDGIREQGFQMWRLRTAS